MQLRYFFAKNNKFTGNHLLVNLTVCSDARHKDNKTSQTAQRDKSYIKADLHI